MTFSEVGASRPCSDRRNTGSPGRGPATARPARPSCARTAMYGLGAAATRAIRSYMPTSQPSGRQGDQSHAFRGNHDREHARQAHRHIVAHEVHGDLGSARPAAHRHVHDPRARAVRSIHASSRSMSRSFPSMVRIIEKGAVPAVSGPKEWRPFMERTGNGPMPDRGRGGKIKEETVPSRPERRRRGVVLWNQPKGIRSAPSIIPHSSRPISTAGTEVRCPTGGSWSARPSGCL